MYLQIISTMITICFITLPKVINSWQMITSESDKVFKQNLQIKARRTSCGQCKEYNMYIILYILYLKYYFGDMYLEIFVLKHILSFNFGFQSAYL